MRTRGLLIPLFYYIKIKAVKYGILFVRTRSVSSYQKSHETIHERFNISKVHARWSNKYSSVKSERFYIIFSVFILCNNGVLLRHPNRWHKPEGNNHKHGNLAGVTSEVKAPTLEIVIVLVQGCVLLSSRCRESYHRLFSRRL